MTQSQLPATVQALLRDHLTSFEQLEILLLLQAETDIDWTLATLSERTRIAADLVHDALRGLIRSELIVQKQASPASYRFGPRDPNLRQVVSDLQLAYRDQRTSVLSSMSVNAIERIRSGTLRAFSDSFLFKRKDEDR